MVGHTNDSEFILLIIFSINNSTDPWNYYLKLFFREKHSDDHIY